MAVLHKPAHQVLMPAEMYDALELAALEFGGIGWGMMYADVQQEEPLCAHGLLEYARGKRDWRAQRELLELGITPLVNDWVFHVRRIKEGKRIPFERWCQALGVVRDG